MTTTTAGQATREGQPEKRAAILLAARELFLRDGFDRTSMDAISRLAKVSKRTVYDYYGDKRRLLVGVVETEAEVLMAALQEAVDAHLSDEAGIVTVAGLEAALQGFAVAIGATVHATTAYAVVFRLIGANREMLRQDLDGHFLTEAPEELLASRLARFGELGLLDVADARLAAEHFKGLTILLAYAEEPEPALADPDRVHRIMSDGVHAFMRAYAVRPPR